VEYSNGHFGFLFRFGVDGDFRDDQFVPFFFQFASSDFVLSSVPFVWAERQWIFLVRRRRIGKIGNASNAANLVQRRRQRKRSEYVNKARLKVIA
jgi:hypothetical protein